MNSLLCMDTSDYGERVLLYRVFLKEVKAEALVLLTGMMNDYPLTKKDISEYAAGKITFTCYTYGDGYVFEGRLTQAQSKSLSYLFSDPYSSGEAIFAEVLAQGFVPEEKKLAASKEKILYERSLLEGSSYPKTLTHLVVPSSLVPINGNMLKEIKLSDLQVVLDKIHAATEGDILSLGEAKTNKLKNLVLKENPLPPLTEANRKEVSFASLDDESLTYVFSHSKISSSAEKKALMADLTVLIAAVDQKLMNLVSLDYETHFGLLNDHTSYLTYTVKKGKVDSLQERMPFAMKEKVDPAFFKDVSSSLAETKMEEIRLKMDSSCMIHELLLARDLGYSYQPSMVSEEQLAKMASTLTVEEVILMK